MKTKLHTLLAAVLTMAFASFANLAAAADSKPTPILGAQVILTEKPDDYLAGLARINTRIKAVTGLDTLRHAWVGDFAGENSHAIVVVSSFESAAAANATTVKLAGDAEHQALTAELGKIRKLGPSWLYKAVRYEGVHAGGAVYNTNLRTTDEAGYLKAMDALRAITDAGGFKDARLNVYRIVAGRDEGATHLVVISLPDRVRLGALLDWINESPEVAVWLGTAAKLRTVHSNSTWHEITK